ncbi:MAG: hypothetical protein LC104_09280 [Bacteroidales bacterium]|nr:hypothetical protein [Bacteroidales bacterium]
MPLAFDATLKSIVAGRPGDFSEVFGLPSEGPIQLLNVDLSIVTAATDVVLAYGKPIHTIVDLNFQTGPDSELPARLHTYSAILNQKHKVPIHSTLVLMRPKADHEKLTGVHTYGTTRSGVEFRYEVIRLWEQSVERYLHASLGVLPLTMLCKMPEDQPLPQSMREIVQEIELRLTREASTADAAVILKTTHILAGLRVKKQHLPAIFRGVGIMSELTAYDELVEMVQHGEQRGKINMGHEILLRLGSKRLGDPDAHTVEELHTIQDLERLNGLMDRLLTAQSWEELLATE